MSSIALIACDHGFGHTKRCYIYGLELARNNFKVTLFARRDGLEKFSKIFGVHKNLTFSFFNTYTKLDSDFKQLTNWLRELPDLSEFEKVVSDNLPEALELRSDVILSGSFLWHLDVPNLSDEYKTYSANLLSKYKPKHIATGFFISKELSKVSDIVPIGIIGNQVSGDPIRSCFDGALLISGGKSGAFQKEFKTLVSQLSKNQKPRFARVFVDPWLMPKDAPDWMEIGNFDQEMYDEVSVALIRPGVGTVTDCIRNNIFIVSIHESHNKEMITNSSAITAARCGMEATYDTIDQQFLNYTVVEHYSKFLEKKNHLSFNGEVDFVRVLKDLSPS
jgi:hypothetical protein